MKLEPPKFRTLVRALVESLSPEDAATLVGIARLAVDADSTEDDDELASYDVVAAELCAMGGLDVAVVERNEALKNRGPDDRAQRMLSYSAALSATPVKELAYACANLLTLADLAIQPSESQFLGDLQAALDIDDTREAAVAALVNEAVRE
ncbi:MAG TPA: hypothetical protein VGG74_00850 [Kofleriaceae bacterium]|jgi:hypothetical protein